MNIEYRFCKIQTVKIPLDRFDRKKNKLTTVELYHFDKETFHSDLLGGKVEVVTMSGFSKGHKIRINRFYIFVKLPGKTEFEYLKSYRAGDRTRYITRVIR